MFKTLAAAAALAALATAAVPGPGAAPGLSLAPTALSLSERLLRLHDGGPLVLDARCCQRCMGPYKACGNSCIKRNYVCRKAPGCAC